MTITIDVVEQPGTAAFGEVEMGTGVKDDASPVRVGDPLGCHDPNLFAAGDILPASDDCLNGASRDRTDGLQRATLALSQLSYSPEAIIVAPASSDGELGIRGWTRSRSSS